MILLDANYILRFLLKDNPQMYEISKECIKNNNCIIANEVLSEVVFVLLKVYKVSKDDIEKSISSILKYDNIVINDKAIIIEALNLFATKNLDFVDCILCIKSKKYEVKTFDKKLNKCIQTFKT